MHRYLMCAINTTIRNPTKRLSEKKEKWHELLLLLHTSGMCACALNIIYPHIYILYCGTLLYGCHRS
jgi:hypothetical protein